MMKDICLQSPTTSVDDAHSYSASGTAVHNQDSRHVPWIGSGTNRRVVTVNFFGDERVYVLVSEPANHPVEQADMPRWIPSWILGAEVSRW